MPGRLSNKVAVITGSSSGIGRATALAFANEGAILVCSDLKEEARSEYRTDTSDLTTVQEAEKLGAKAIYVNCDTTSSSDVEGLIKKAVEAFGRVDIMVNNAGITVEAGEHGSRPVWEYDEAALDKTLAVNVKGVFLGIKFASRQMKDQEPGPNGDRGWIINLASVYGLGGGPGISAYAASKHAVMGLTKVAAWDCAPHRIHVNALCPGYTQTSFIHALLTPEADAYKKQVEAQHPFKGLGSPQDIARAAVFLASEDASWVTGIGLPVDGGYTSI
ncbi:short-chain dehydrogenase/reductase-like protein [Cucurbitaria berberidis CBS 394.84]|uniref:Short-chain dehydrogenase/reductase-like protein n=1 Tax=Cucurbitaria berberidis CBS 394.84 TaxID=1168544 RepID=A0A9P4GSQ7_9PLEO|nr:short-chain dehydrogenase/reductase-like protein [Cucurbitaria berberidis CBS 394.84]KAF1850632.1 short-chain dehydrogenase/reductase-like protein [Cucurbitaria berberidis CBS 394.84]